MSKSIGNVVDPNEVLKKFSSDTLRYYLMLWRSTAPTCSFSEQAMTMIHNADLADVIGNLVHRVTNLTKKNCGGVVPTCAADKIDKIFSARVSPLSPICHVQIQHSGRANCY